MPSDKRQNTELLERYLWDDETDDVVQAEEDLESTQDVQRQHTGANQRIRPVLHPLLPETTVNEPEEPPDEPEEPGGP